VSEQLRFDIGPTPAKPKGTPKPKAKRAPKNITCLCKTAHAEPHVLARQLGAEDGRRGKRRNRWPSGTYGHADYELGYAEGELRATP